jgi:hypothetical protein
MIGAAEIQPEWLLAVPIFGLGFLVGYFVRSMMSRRRRRWVSWGRSRDSRHAIHQEYPFTLRLTGSPSQGGLLDTNDNSPLCVADAPALSALNLAREREVSPKDEARNSEQSGGPREEGAANPRRERS